MLLEFRHRPLNQIASALRQSVRLAEVIEMTERKSEVAVKRIDQNLERQLKRVGVAALAPREFARECLGLHPEAAQIAEQLEKDAEAIGRGRMPILQHQRRIQRGHVAMQNTMRDAASANLGVSARDRRGLRRLGN